MKYVALLRGINVGGNTKVEMSRLKRVLETLGAGDVKTYINSGNVLFSDGREKSELKALIEQAIVKEFNYTVPVVLRTADEIISLHKTIPVQWTNDMVQRTDIMFLWDEIDNKTILEKISINPDIERVIYAPGALVWNIGRENVKKGGGIKLIKTDVYKQMTIRNVNTLRKLVSLLDN